MPMKTVPKGYVAASRVGKKAVTFYVTPTEHDGLREIADFEGWTLGELIVRAVNEQYGRKMEKIRAMKLNHTNNNVS